MKEIILVGYITYSGIFTPCFFFETQTDFESWLNANHILEKNVSIYRISIPSYDSLSDHMKQFIIDNFNSPYL